VIKNVAAFRKPDQICAIFLNVFFKLSPFYVELLFDVNISYAQSLTFNTVARS
jgi:hypothetical protein